MQWIWLIFSAYVFITALIFALSSHINQSVYQVISVVLYFSIVGCAIASCAFRHGSNVAVLSHYSRQVYIFILYSVLYWIWNFAFFAMISSPAVHKLSAVVLNQIYLMSAVGYGIKMLLFTVSIYGLLRARDHISLGRTRPIIKLTLIILAIVYAIAMVIMLLNTRW